MMRTLICLVLLATSGCYYTFGTAPPSSGMRRPSDPRPHCTTSRALAITDTVFAVEGAGALALGAFALARSKDDGSLPAGEANTFAGLFVVTGAVMLLVNGLSARAGYRDSARCRAMGGE